MPNLCPKCGATLRKNGRPNGYQAYRCPDCPYTRIDSDRVHGGQRKYPIGTTKTQAERIRIGAKPRPAIVGQTSGTVYRSMQALGDAVGLSRQRVAVLVAQERPIGGEIWVKTFLD